jgi:2-C-methyl-D-erythritol 2,4-cyclodiphosphate synthase
LEAISDGDVAIHSIVDAILGGIAMGSIGEHFPEDDLKWKGADSKIFLKYCGDLLMQKQACIINIDSTIVCEYPRISGYCEAMKRSVSRSLGIDESRINIKGKTMEGLGFIGTSEGVAAYSVVTIRV